MTLAQAGAVSGAGASGGGTGASTGAGGAAGGGTGGGLSATTVGIVGGAVAGGAVAVKELALGGAAPGGQKYSGSFSGTLAMVFSGCTRREQQSGTLELELSEEGGAINGSAKVDGDIQILAPNPCGPPGYTNDSFGFDTAAVGGNASSLTFTSNTSNQYTDPDGTSGSNRYQYSFVGSQSGSEIMGTLTVTRTITNSRGGPPGVGSIVYTVTLR